MLWATLRFSLSLSLTPMERVKPGEVGDEEERGVLSTSFVLMPSFLSIFFVCVLIFYMVYGCIDEVVYGYAEVYRNTMG